MNEISLNQSTTALGQSFLDALAAQDFARLQSLMAPQIRFRALLPPRSREEHTASAAVGWLQTWFGPADSLEVLQSSASPVFDRLYLSYRLRTHDDTRGWRLIEQHAYCDVRDGQIADMWLLCSGFRPLTDAQTVPTRFSQGDTAHGTGNDSQFTR